MSFLFVSSNKAVAVPKRVGEPEVKWLAAGIRAARERFDPPGDTTTHTLEFALTFDDYLALSRSPRATDRGDRAFDRQRSRSLAPFALAVFVVAVVAQVATGIAPLRSAGATLIVAAGSAGVGWVGAGLHLRALRLRHARIAFQRSGERLRLCIEPEGIRLTNADGSELFRWADLTLDVTPDYHYVQIGPRNAVLIPSRLGPEAVSFVAVMRSRLTATPATT